MERIKLCLFDDYWIDFRCGTVRRWYEPAYIGAHTDPRFRVTTFCNAVYHPESGKYRLFYLGMPDVLNGAMHSLCLAETEDFIHFEPVILNDEPDGPLHNLIRDGRDGAHIHILTYDTAEPDPAKRFKSAAQLFPYGEDSCRDIRLAPATSPDGIHWHIDTQHPAHPVTSDATNSILYNPYTEEYMLFLRAGFVDRRICCKTSKDLMHWSDAEVTVHPGACYNDEAFQTQLYGMIPTYSDGIFYAFMQRYYTSLTDMDFTKLFGFVETELYYSYDGYHFMPTSGRPVAPRTQAPDYGCTQMYLLHLCESADHKEYIVCGLGSRVIHCNSKSVYEFTESMDHKTSANIFFRIRKDGFCGIEGLGLGAKIITKGLQMLKPDLSFNVNASCGYARFGLMRHDGSFIEGFSFDDCERFAFSDDTSVIPKWKSHTLDEVLGRQVRIAVELSGATLHAICLTARPYINEPQTSFADPTQLSAINSSRTV